MRFFSLARQSVLAWRKDKASRWAAALAYYTIFSLPPLLIILFAVLGMVFDRQSVRTEVYGHMEAFIGDRGLSAIQSLVDSAASSSNSFLATVVGVIVLAFAATGILLVLQDALNTVWGVEPKSGGAALLLRKRGLSLGLILAIGFVLVVFLLLSAAVSFFMRVLVEQYSGAVLLLPIMSELLSLFLIACLFALLLKYLPDVRIPWRTAWIGAWVTAIMFTVGKIVIGWYLGRTDLASAYGAAGSLIVLLVWIYYSAQVFFLGAEFTKVYANASGASVRPVPYAQFIHPKRFSIRMNLSLLQKARVVAKVLLWERELFHMFQSVRRLLKH